MLVWSVRNLSALLTTLFFFLEQGLLFLQIDNDQEGATQRAAAIYFSLIICNLISFGTYAVHTIIIVFSYSFIHSLFLTGDSCVQP